MEYTQEITLELNSNVAYTTVGAKQGDHNTRIIKVHITQNGIDYNLVEQGVSAAYFRFRKPDGKAIINSCEINSDNTISLALTSQTLAVSGRGYADITLMSGSSILSTVSFIIVIMSSPQVAGEATSSSEFGYLNAVVEDATHIIYEAEAWAAGTRGGTAVFSNNELSSVIDATVIDHIVLQNNGEIFKSKVGSNPGLKRIFTFTYDSGSWGLNTQAIEGTTITNYNPEVVGSLNDYGITIFLISGVDSPDNGDSIIITLQEADLQYENNAKYYTQQAELSKQSIENLDASVEMLDENASPIVDKTLIEDVTVLSASENLGEITINKDTFISAVQDPGNYTFTYSGANWIYQSNIISLANYGISYSGTAASGNSIVINYNGHVHLNFQLPRGETGNVNFMTFEVNTDDGELYMYRPSDLTQVDFSIIESGENAGCLGVEINMGGNG